MADILYLDPVGGISGDMTVAALVELGVPLERLRAGLSAVGLKGVELSTERATRHHLAGTRFLVSAPAEAHPHRAYREIRRLIADSSLAPGARNTALDIFARLAEAEGEVHGIAAEEVDFHEVGAWDSIADCVCAAVALDHLRPAAVFCGPVPLGGGTVNTAHGTMPVPAPAALALLRGFPVVQGGPAFERTTPTGAAILAAVAQPAPDPFAYTPVAIGLGIGAKDHPQVPNVLRAVLGRRDGPPTEGRDTVECAEANLDDANPEWIGFLMERLLEAGALDVSLIAVQMKKNRPGTLIQVLYPPPLRGAVADLLFSEVTTLGVRFRSQERLVLPREKVKVATPLGEVEGVAASHDGAARFSPEFESCRRIALEKGVPLREVYRAAHQAWDAREK